MSTNNSRQAYEDCYDLMDNALAADMGVRVGFASHGEAKHFRTRMNYARTLDREFNLHRYEGADPRRGRSDYDILSIRNRHTEGKYWVYVEKRKTPEVVEEIKPNEGADSIGPRPIIRRA